MKITWEEQDIKPGRRVGSLKHSERYMIGYRQRKEDLGNDFTLVSLLDGMVNSLLYSRQDVADFLNKNQSLPLEIIEEVWRNKENQ